MTSSALLDYLCLETQLLELRNAHAASERTEDEFSDKLEELWWKLAPSERALLDALPAPSLHGAESRSKVGVVTSTGSFSRVLISFQTTTSPTAVIETAATGTVAGNLELHRAHAA